MIPDNTIISLRIAGDRALFTDPREKVERGSYHVITPSAARGVLQAIYWKPEMDYEIERIIILRPVKTETIRRNELKSNATKRTTYIDIAKDRTQRRSRILRDVAYVVEARILIKDDDDFKLFNKHREQFERRVSQNQCFSVPYLGCREFPATFSFPNLQERSIAWNEDLGLMLYGIDYSDAEKGVYKPIYFDAIVEDGIINVANAQKYKPI
jgi:CRISPR-associated protein Cas5d